MTGGETDAETQVEEKTWVVGKLVEKEEAVVTTEKQEEAVVDKVTAVQETTERK